ncbi:MAG: DUF4390 domain-containing protein [Gemmatimonadetes bacterium]|nr:MAG: DUF4390 domain-containing protein [Gemmatimonadota bacterium]
MGQRVERPPALRAEPESGVVHFEFGDLLLRPDLERALHSGLPVRVHVTAELWRDRFFDNQEGRAEWRATVLYDPLDSLYHVRIEPDGRPSPDASRPTGSPPPPDTAPPPDAEPAPARTDQPLPPPVERSLAGVTRTLERAFRLPLAPRRPGRFYYLGQVEVETLSLSDLQELERWLRGDVAGRDSGEGAAGETAREERGGGLGGALGRGARRLFVRILGVPTRRVRLRTEKFDYGGGVPDADADPAGPADPGGPAVDGPAGAPPSGAP